MASYQLAVASAVPKGNWRGLPYNHTEVVALGRRDDLDSLVQHNVHERVVAAQDAHDLALAVQLHCIGR